ncbi:MAG: sensor histidine kinase N-terminal domain-containing protein [Burkholderiales bacterium]|nr:sensor histidine kinase N-terminal domain-containing protein [Burkholderiales bacterium]
MSHDSTPSTNGQSSLFGEILDWMLAPLLLLWPMSVAVTWLVAKAIANQAFDSALEQQVQNVRQQVLFTAAQPSLPANALRNLNLADESDLRYAQFRGVDGSVQDGDNELPIPPDEERKFDVQLRTIVLQGHELRVASLWLAPDGNPASNASANPALLQIGETIHQRARLANAIIRGVILPQFAILPIALFLVWLALSKGLLPITLLQKKIRARQSDDLSPITSPQIPQEIFPLVQSLNEMLARLEHAIAQQKRFIADAAHQMKTPLAGMRMQAELALRDAAQNNHAEVQRSLQQLAASSENATRLVNQLLALARAENQQPTAQHHRLDLNELARQVLQDWVAPALARRIDLGLEAPPDPMWLNGQPMLLRELISNLLDNAIRYTPEQGIVTLRLQELAHEIVLEVEDNGPGIAPTEREQVFERFYRILGNAAQGSGLGLAIVREIARQHQASISILDNLHYGEAANPGCLVRLIFPKLAPQASSAPSPAATLTLEEV